MAEPTIQKTWRFNINRKTASGTNITWHRNQMLAQHIALTSDDGNWNTVPTTLWSVDHSCDGSTAGTPADGVDRWLAITDLVWDQPGDAHSWCVYNTGLNGGVAQVLVDLDNGANPTVNANARSIRVTMSWGGLFTGGTTTAAPTAADQSQEVTRGQVVGSWIGDNASGVTHDIAWHLLMSSDGKEMRLFYLRDHTCFGIWAFGELDGYPTSLTKNMYGSVWSNDVTTSIEALSGANLSWLNGDQLPLAIAEEAGAVTLIHANWVDQSAPSSLFDHTKVGGKGDETEDAAVFGEIGTWETVTAGQRGPKGRLKDIWVVSSYYQNGTTFPADGKRRWHKVGGQIVVPWDGTPSVAGTLPENIF